MSDQPTQDNTVDINANNSSVREELVNTAVKFLENPNVIKTSLAEQQRFLRRKGLTDEEIRLACERSGAYAFHEQRTRAPPPALPSPIVPHSSQQQGVLQYSFFDKLRDIVHNVAIFSFVAYSIYQFYQKFIAPFLFGKKKKSIEESIGDLEKNLKESVKDLNTNLSSVKTEVDKIRKGSEYSSTERQLSDLKTEIATVKGLLLSRNQFPSVSKSSILRPSIPAWQKTSISHDSDPDSDQDRKAELAEDMSEVGSGSGSSEHEHNTKNSDSSLDIISFSSKDSDFQRHKRKENVDKE